jgi:hypothetical protein
MRHKVLLPTLALVLALAPQVRATVLLPGDLGDIARGASMIVRGTVVDTRAGWVDGRRRVETVVTLDVAETLKGSVATRVSFHVPGGVIGRYRSVTIGAPTFTTGEEVIVCLGTKVPELPYVLGLSQGVFRVRRDAASGQRVVTTPVLLADRQSATAIQRGDPARQPMPLEQFNATLRTALNGTKPVREPKTRDIKSEGLR